MHDLKELYQEVILDHNRNPRNFGCLEHPSCQARGHNPLCGDQLNLFIELAGDVIQNIQFQGRGCAISQASASLMTEAVKGLHVAEALALFELMHQFLTLDNFDVNQVPSMKLQVLAGVKAYPARVKCASLAWHTLQAALLQQNDIAKTE